MEIIGDNTTVTSVTPKGKDVYCRGEPHKYWLELQFVDENNTPVTGLDVLLEYRPLASAQEVAMWSKTGYEFNPTPHRILPLVLPTARGWSGSTICTG